MTARVVEVATGVFLCRARDVNWVLLVEGGQATVIDAGYPGDTADVIESLHRVGVRAGDVTAILLTHAHVDHLGAVDAIRRRSGAPVLTGEREARHARREFLEQAGPVDVVANLWRPHALAWTMRITGKGAGRDVGLPAARGFDASGPLDVPGRPTPVLTGGHTSGHTAYLLADRGIAVTGDELITGHALSTAPGPQRTPPFFERHGGDVEMAMSRLADLDADVILPGHGDVWHQSIRAAVDRARG